jgi:hypothetical protein
VGHLQVRGLKKFLQYKNPKVLLCDEDAYDQIKQLIDAAFENGGGKTEVWMHHARMCLYITALHIAVTKYNRCRCMTGQGNAW